MAEHANNNNNKLLKTLLQSTVLLCVYAYVASDTGEAVRDSVAVRVVRLQDVDDGVWKSVLADLDVLDGRLYKHRVLVVDIGHRDAHIGRPAQRRHAIVSGRHSEVVRVVWQTVVVQSPTRTVTAQ